MVLRAELLLQTVFKYVTGTVRFHNVKTVQHAKGHLVSVSRSGEIGIADELGRERERYKLPYGASILLKDGEMVEAGGIVALGIRIHIH